MKTLNSYKFRVLLSFILILILAAFGFKDNTVLKYKELNERTILREDGAMYQKGMINLMFKNEMSGISKNSFNIESIDRILSGYSVTEIYQRFPFSQQVISKHPESENLLRIYTIKYDSKIDPTVLSSLLLNDNSDLIEWCEPDFVYTRDFIPSDPSIGSQYHINRINCYQAWDITQGDTSVVVGIVDSGSDLDHPDLAANIKYNYADPVNGVDDDANGFIDDFKGWDYYYSDNEPNIMGGSDHGSHVSGCASQVTNNGVHGGGPGFKVKLRITKHAPDFPDNGIYYGYDGITYMYMNNVKIINCSWGGGYSSMGQTIVTNAWNAGSIVVASAGNQESNAPRYPASYDNAINVASTNSSDIKSGFSNWHTTVDVSAPGDAILSTVWDNSYATYSGTSMSSPVTAGTIGLIKSRYPSWTAQQIVDRLKLGVDSIYHLNPNYIDGLGTGRINALKCVTDKPIVSVISYTHNDSLYGNNDKVYEPNEKIPVMLTYKNIWLSGNNVSLRLTTTDTNVLIEKDSIFVGNLAAYTTYSTTAANTFEVKAKPNCPFDKTVTFRLSSSNSAYGNNNANTINITFRQGWATHNINNLKMALTRDGAIGKKVEAYGTGLFISGYPQVNNLYEGGLMIGTSNTKVSDVARKGGTLPFNKSDTDFVALQAYTVNTPGTVSNQDGFGIFNDDNAGSNKIGVTVNATSYAWNTATDQDYIILRYTIRNTSGAAISNMYAGLFTVFVPRGKLSNNIVSVDNTNKFAYVKNSDSTNPHLGVALLSQHTMGFNSLASIDFFNGFQPQEKWDALSSGIVPPPATGGLYGTTVSAGPFNIAANDSVIVGFAIVKGNDVADITANVNKARTKFGPIGITPISGIIPQRYELYQNYPNPFNPVTTIKFAIPKANVVKIRIFDILGKEMALLTEQKLEAGVYELPFDGSAMSSGIYFYRIETSGFTDVKKMVLVK